MLVEDRLCDSIFGGTKGDFPWAIWNAFASSAAIIILKKSKKSHHPIICNNIHHHHLPSTWLVLVTLTLSLSSTINLFIITQQLLQPSHHHPHWRGQKKSLQGPLQPMAAQQRCIVVHTKT